MLKKLLSGAPTHHFDSQFSYELEHKVYLSETMCGVLLFLFCLVFIKVYIFVQQKVCTLLNIIPFKIKILEKPYAVLLPNI